jgi:hypothetical protein
MEVQTKIPAALSAIHNFIQKHDRDEGQLPSEDFIDAMWESNDIGSADVGGCADGGGADLRDEIAAAMWQDYQHILAERNLDAEDNEDYLSDDEIDMDLGDHMNVDMEGAF